MEKGDWEEKSWLGMDKGELGIEKILGNGEWGIYKGEGKRKTYLPWCSVEFLGGVLEPDTRKSPPQGLYNGTSNYVFLKKLQNRSSKKAKKKAKTTMS